MSRCAPFPEAQCDLERAARIHPSEPEIWKNMGMAQLAQAAAVTH